MADTRVILKKSSVASKIPTTSDLVHGELAVNFTDGRLYFKNSSNNIEFFEQVNSFKNIDVSGQDTLTADGGSDTLTLVEGDNISITTDSATNEVTINSTASSGGGGGDVFAIEFFLADGTRDNIGVTAANEIPFFLANGTEDNIALASTL